MKALTSLESSAKVYLQTNKTTRQDCYCESRQNLNGAGAGGDSRNLCHLGFFYSLLGGDAALIQKKLVKGGHLSSSSPPIKRRYTHGL